MSFFSPQFPFLCDVRCHSLNVSKSITSRLTRRTYYIFPVHSSFWLLEVGGQVTKLTENSAFDHLPTYPD